LQSSSEAIVPQTNEVSIYKGELTQLGVLDNVNRIKKSFPVLPIDFYDMFCDRIRDNSFNDDRLRDAVNHVIDTCVYPTPTIAQFISFDKKYRVYSYEEMLKKLDEFGPGAWDFYKSIQFPDREKRIWVHVDDIKKYKL